MKLSKCIASSTSFIQSSFLSAVPAAAAYFGDKVIQTVRAIDPSSIKDQVKDVTSLGSSTVSALALAYSTSELLTTLSKGGWKELTECTKAAVVFAAAVAVVGAGYSMYEFGVEQHTLAAGMAATAGVFMLKVANSNAQPTSENQEDQQVQNQYRIVP